MDFGNLIIRRKVTDLLQSGSFILQPDGRSILPPQYLYRTSLPHSLIQKCTKTHHFEDEHITGVYYLDFLYELASVFGIPDSVFEHIVNPCKRASVITDAIYDKVDGIEGRKQFQQRRLS